MLASMLRISIANSGSQYQWPSRHASYLGYAQGIALFFPGTLAVNSDRL